MKNLLLLLIIILSSCNNIIHEEDENKINDIKTLDTLNSEGKLNDIINQNRDSEDSIKNVEKIEEQLKNNPK